MTPGAADPAGQPEDAPRLSEFAHPGEEVPKAMGADGQRYLSATGTLAYLIVLGATVAGVILSATGRWRVGMFWVAGSLLAAAAARLVLPENQAGLLHVRRRLVDVTLLIVLGGGLLAAAAAIPVPRVR